MDTLGNVYFVAQKLFDRLGRGGADIIDIRARAHRQEGDVDAARFWMRVASMMRELDPPGSSYITAGRRLSNVAPPQSHFRDSFDAMPQATLLLQPNLVIVGANKAFLSVTMTRKSDIVGCGIFDVFPGAGGDHGSDGVGSLTDSLLRVVESGRPHHLGVLRYDIRNRDGVFEEHWWETVNTPAFDEDGKLSLILNQTRDVTGMIRASAALDGILH